MRKCLLVFVAVSRSKRQPTNRDRLDDDDGCGGALISSLSQQRWPFGTRTCFPQIIPYDVGPATTVAPAVHASTHASRKSFRFILNIQQILCITLNCRTIF